MKIQISKRTNPKQWQVVLIELTGILIAFLIIIVILEMSGLKSLKILNHLIEGTFFNFYGLSETLVKTIPLALASLGVSIAFRMGLWNIGAEGQFHIGAVFVAGIAIYLGSIPYYLSLPLLVLLSAIGGSLWAILAIVPKIFFGINEIITTLLLNYVAILGTNYLIYGPWKDPESFNFPLTPLFPESTWLPIIGDTRLHIGLFLIFIFALVLNLFYKRSKWGFETRVIGDNLLAAKYAGIPIKKTMFITFLLSGALAGIAGMTEVSGIIHRLQPGFSPGYGYTAIIVAWLARLNPWIILIVSFLLGGLLAGTFILQSEGLASATIYMFQGLILFCVLMAEFFIKYQVTIKNK